MLSTFKKCLSECSSRANFVKDISNFNTTLNSTYQYSNEPRYPSDTSQTTQLTLINKLDRYEYRRPSLFAIFLSANSLIHIGKLVQNDNFPVKNGLFICDFKIRGPKWRNVSTANNFTIWLTFIVSPYFTKQIILFTIERQKSYNEKRLWRFCRLKPLQPFFSRIISQFCEKDF